MSLFRNIFPYLSFAGILLIGPGTATAADQQPDQSQLILTYEAYFGGMHLLSSEVRLKQQSEEYEIQTEARARGLFDFFTGYRGRAESSGTLMEGKIKPTNHSHFGQWDDRERWLKLAYLAKQGPIITERDQGPRPDWEKDLSPIDPLDIRDSQDPISALLAMSLQLQEGKSCEADMEIYDGRRHYRLLLSDGGLKDLKQTDYGVYSGPARSCQFDVERLGGFTPEPSKYSKSARNRIVYVAQPQDFSPPIPVRAEVETDYGWLMIHLTAVKKAEN